MVTVDSRKFRSYIVPTFKYRNNLGEVNLIAMFNMKDHMMPRAWDYEEGTLNMFGGALEPEDNGDHLVSAMREVREELPGIIHLADGKPFVEIVNVDGNLKVYHLDLDVGIGEKKWREILKSCEEGLLTPVSNVRFHGLRGRGKMSRDDFTTDLAWKAAQAVFGTI